MRFPLNDPRITSGYGLRASGPHYGLDFGAVEGTPVFAVASGTVEKSYESKSDDSRGIKGYGNRVVIDHGSGLKSTYNHLDVRIAQTGQSVEEGEIVGTVGNTGYSFGAHLHFEIIENGKLVDPLKYLSPQEHGAAEIATAIIAGAIGAFAIGVAIIFGR